MPVDAGTAIAGVGTLVGGVVWLVRLEGRINLGDERFRNLQGDIDEIKADVKTLLTKPFKQRGGDGA